MTEPNHPPVRAGEQVGGVVALSPSLNGGWRWRCPCGAEFVAQVAKVRGWEASSGAKCPRCYYAARVERLANAVPETRVHDAELALTLLCRAAGATLDEGATFAERAAVVARMTHHARRAAVALLAVFAGGAR